MRRVESLETRSWQAATIVALLLAALVPLYVALYVPSPVRETQLESSVPFVTSVTKSLSELGGRAQVSIVVDNEPLKNLVLASLTVTNKGSVAIVPADFYEKLAINVSDQWKILLVRNSNGTTTPMWTRVNDQKFEASPELLNPGDQISIDAYATNTKLSELSFSQVYDLKPSWSAHILNLKSITEQKNSILESAHDPLYTVTPIVYLSGSALATTLLGATLFMAVYIRLLYHLDFITSSRLGSIAAIIGVGALSLASSEAMATYLFPNFFYQMFGINHWLNMPLIILNFISLVVLSWKARARGVGELPGGKA
jgi:hypothetical protein